MKKGFLALVCGMLFVSSEGYALIHGQALVGQRKLKPSGGDEITGQEFKLAVHLDPIPLVPVGFGAYLSATNFDAPEGMSSYQGSEIGLELTAWSPVDLLGLTPYAKLGYTILGGYVAEVDVDALGSVKFLSTPSGTRLAAGLKWSPLPLVALMLELEQTDIKLKSDKIKASAGIDTSNYTMSDVDTSSFGILLGVEVGI
ncbi:MAG: hypothetical protein ACOH5I_21685 [Oligoflexus sp.]